MYSQRVLSTLLLLIATALPPLRAQNAAISGVINTYTAVTGFASAKQLNVATTSGFKAGDVVMIIQMRGAVVDLASTDSTIYGSITNLKSAGHFEFGKVAGVAFGTITLLSDLRLQYDTAGLVQLVRVPHYADVTIAGTLTALPWNGRVGGIVALDASGTVTLNADVDVSKLGFTGGHVVDGNAFTETFYGLASPRDWKVAGLKGEGIAIVDEGNVAGRGAVADGGGGGNARNSGGGGGSNGGAGGKGGYQWDVLGSFDIGGRGGYALRNVDLSNRIFLGGGGGAGHENDSAGSAGGNGGGIVVMRAGGIAGNGHIIIADGEPAATSGIDGAGGGGSGGTVVLLTTKVQRLSVRARGGNGGDVNPVKSTCHGPGGGGGGGVLWLGGINLRNSIDYIDLSGGRAGIHVDTASPCYRGAYGAAAGDVGLVVVGHIFGPQVYAGGDHTICKGDSVQLIAEGDGVASLIWTPADGLSCTVCDRPVARPDQTTAYIVTGTSTTGEKASDTVVVRVVDCADTNTDLTFYLPTRCEGHTERVWLPFNNQYHVDSITSATFTGQFGANISFDAPLPIAITPNATVYFPIIVRWTTPGRHTTVLSMTTSSSVVYRIKLVAITDSAFTPVLDIGRLHMGMHGTLFDTCIVVTNALNTSVTITDTAVTSSMISYSLADPILPIHLPPHASVSLCIRGRGIDPYDSSMLSLGGSIIDDDGIDRCVAHHFVIDTKATEVLSVEATGERDRRLRCSPNPASGALNIAFTAADGEAVTVRVIDLRGVEMMMARSERLDEGRHEMRLDARTLPGGSYIVRVEHEGESELAIVSIVH